MQQKEKVKRFSVSLPPALVGELDEACRSMGYASRSKAIHDALRGFITEFEWMRKKGGWVTGAIAMLHYLDKASLPEELTEVQHKFMNIIHSTMHIHLEEDKCLEIIAVSGPVSEVKELTRNLMTKRGVKQVKIAAIAP
jgi:CopG family nickel-responsive transcriptional regulator